MLSGEANAEPEQIAGARAEPTLFGTLGVRPVMGRTFTPDEARPGGAAGRRDLLLALAAAVRRRTRRHRPDGDAER